MIKFNCVKVGDSEVFNRPFFIASVQISYNKYYFVFVRKVFYVYYSYILKCQEYYLKNLN